MGFIAPTQEGLAVIFKGAHMNTRFFLNTLFALSFVALFVSCAPSKQAGEITTTAKQASIIGGSNSTAEYQKQHGVVGLYLILKDARGNEGGAICTGTLIRSNVVLTAAHCLVASGGMKLVGGIAYFTTDLETAMGEMDKDNMSNIRMFKKIHYHESYKKDGQDEGVTHDIGLVRLSEDAPADFTVASLPPASLSTALVKGATFTLSGFGINKYENDKDGQLVGEGDGVLRQVAGVKIIEVESSGLEILLDQTSGGACHGDSGGPAYFTDVTTQKTYVVGVTSRGEEPCKTMSIYSSTLGFSDWINTATEKILK